MNWSVPSWILFGTLAMARPTLAKPAPFDPPDLRALPHPQVEAKSVVPTHVPVTIAVELGWAQAELEQRIPRQLHRESNREVAPGIWVDAELTRGVVDLRIQRDKASGFVPLDLQLVAHSRLGRMDLTLGQCRTTIDVELELPVSLASNGRLSPPSARANLREPCRLSGFDITPLLRRELDQRLAAAKVQVSEHMAQANTVLEQIRAGTFRRLSSAVLGCQRFVPSKLLQAPWVLEHGFAVGRFVVEGGLVNSCAEVTATNVVTESVAAPSNFDLARSTRLGYSELGGALTEYIRLKGVAGTIQAVRAVRVADIDQLALYFQSSKVEGWVFALPIVSSNTLQLDSISSPDSRLLQLVKPVLEALAFPVETINVEVLAQQLVRASNEVTQVFGGTPELKTRYWVNETELQTASDVLVDRDALVVVVHRRSR